MAYLSPSRPRVFGHRGAAALAPENTLPSFAVAAHLGAGYLELDVHGTADGTIVVLHDETVDRTTEATGPVRAMRWSEVERLDAGFRFQVGGGMPIYRGQGVRIPTLEAVLKAFPDHYFNIEIKQEKPAIVDETVAILRNAGVATRTLLAAESGSIMGEIREAVGDEIVTGSSTDDVLEFYGHLVAGTLDGYRPPGVALQIPPQVGGRILVERQSIEAAHGVGLEVHVWTINDATEIERLLALGVDGVMSDAPGLVAQAVRESTSR
ncbi:MAG: glycerophosphodiester phosphodiesterase [Acidobacteriota bacterium]|jgi:glycerophosphoryl diester phosphodiesterase